MVDGSSVLSMLNFMYSVSLLSTLFFVSASSHVVLFFHVVALCVFVFFAFHEFV